MIETRDDKRHKRDIEKEILLLKRPAKHTDSIILPILLLL